MCLQSEVKPGQRKHRSQEKEAAVDNIFGRRQKKAT